MVVLFSGSRMFPPGSIQISWHPPILLYSHSTSPRALTLAALPLSQARIRCPVLVGWSAARVASELCRTVTNKIASQQLDFILKLSAILNVFGHVPSYSNDPVQ